MQLWGPETENSKRLQFSRWRPRRVTVVPVQVQKPEYQGGYDVSSILKASRLETQEKLMIQLESRGRKSPMSSSR